jgi:hypothetical protein
LNLPYEPVPNGPVNIEEDMLVAGGVVVRAAVMAHPETAKPHPVLLFTFYLPDGRTAPVVALIVERGELAALSKVVGDAAEGALRAAS